jgi:hypothetical protein
MAQNHRVADCHTSATTKIYRRRQSRLPPKQGLVHEKRNLISAGCTGKFYLPPNVGLIFFRVPMLG